MAASMRRPACTTPHTSAMYSFSTSRSWNCRDSSWCARVVLRDDHHARRAAIEPVDDARPQLAADAAEIGDVVQQRVDERARGVTRAGMHDHARRLVDDDEVGILVEDLERQRLGCDGSGRGAREASTADAIALTHREVRLRVSRAPTAATTCRP